MGSPHFQEKTKHETRRDNIRERLMQEGEPPVLAERASAEEGGRQWRARARDVRRGLARARGTGRAQRLSALVRG